VWGESQKRPPTVVDPLHCSHGLSMGDHEPQVKTLASRCESMPDNMGNNNESSFQTDETHRRG